MNTSYLCINAGKKAITTNLATFKGQKLFARLIKALQVDVYATNQLQKNYEKTGISYERLRALKEGSIWLGG